VIAAVCGGLLLLILPYYIRLSVSLMIGLPAIALAVASFYMLSEWHARPSVGPLLASGLLLGLSILTKGFTVILVPVWFIGILLTVVKTPAHRQLGLRRWIGPLAWLGALAALAAASVIFVIGTTNLGQLLSIHLQASQVDTFQVSAEFPSLGSYLAESLPLFALAVAGTWRAVKHHRWTALYLVGWMVLGYGLLAATRPIWYHQQLLLTIPAALLADRRGYLSDDKPRPSSRGPPSSLSLACLVLFGLRHVRIQATIGDSCLQCLRTPTR
jgi:4-amino-4-deoxy-L-arabinose transferase-like glycosyltransferase